MQHQVIERAGKTYFVNPAEGELEVRYGLPPRVEFCTSCVVSNQKATPSVLAEDARDSKKTTIPFENGVCQACDYVASKEETDWEGRERQLIELLDKHRSRNGSYDCIVPGSGGKDSVFQAHILKTKYGMHPLTVTWAPHLYTDIGWRNFSNWVHKGGFDNVLVTPSGEVHRKLTELAYRNLLHPFQPFIWGQRHVWKQFARQWNIKLIVYGESHVEYGGRKGEEELARIPSFYYTGDSSQNFRISGLPIDELAEFGITRQSLAQYLPPSEAECAEMGVEAHHLGYYLKWVPQQCYYYAVEHTGFEANSERTEGTYTKYNSIDDKLDGFHYWCGHIKFGIGRCTQEASQEIRHGHITREEGVALVRRYDGEFPNKYFPKVLDYMGMERDEFLEIADSFRSPHLWRQTGNGRELRHCVA